MTSYLFDVSREKQYILFNDKLFVMNQALILCNSKLAWKKTSAIFPFTKKIFLSSAKKIAVNR